MSSNQEYLQSCWDAPSVYRNDLFDGQVALVSGGGSGIGAATALLLARLDAQVVICGRTQEKLDEVSQFAEQRGAKVVAQTCNVREPEQVDDLYAMIDDRFGRLDVLVNNAGGQFPQDAIDFADKGWNAVITNNLNGTWYMMQRAARFWRDHQQSGAIVNVVVVADRGMPGVAHTVAARSGVVGVTKTVAVEWAPLNIRVNCVAPGLTQTRGLEVYPPEAVREFPNANAMRRPGTAMEIAESCVYLAAPSASFVTGEVLVVDGGGNLWGELWTNGRPEYYQQIQG